MNHKEEMLSLLKSLPQASVISADQAKAWLNFTSDNMPEKTEWLIKRCFGLGGSEAGTILSWYSGEIKSRKSISSLVRDKLLMRMPEKGNADMLRGQVLEEHIRFTFEKKIDIDGRKWKRRQDLEYTINNSQPSAYPWMRANVDGVYEIDNNIVIVDFKAPSESSLQTQLRTEGNDEYKAQLNHYFIVAESANINVDSMWLALYDYNKVATEGVQVIEVLPDLVMQQKIVQGCEEIWKSYILKGILPEYIKKEQLTLPEEVPSWVMESAREATRAKLIEEASSRIYEQRRVEIGDWIESQGKLGKLPLYVGSLIDGEPGAMKATAKTIIDEQVAIERLEELGLDDISIDELRKEGKYKDNNLLAKKYDVLRELTFNLILNVKDGLVIDPQMLSDIEKHIKNPPPREQSGFNVEAIKSALVACNENPHDYEREVVSLILDRRQRQDIDDEADMALKSVDKFIKKNYLGACNEIDANDFIGGVPVSEF